MAIPAPEAASPLPPAPSQDGVPPIAAPPPSGAPQFRGRGRGGRGGGGSNKRGGGGGGGGGKGRGGAGAGSISVPAAALSAVTNDAVIIAHAPAAATSVPILVSHAAPSQSSRADAKNANQTELGQQIIARLMKNTYECMICIQRYYLLSECDFIFSPTAALVAKQRSGRVCSATRCSTLLASPSGASRRARCRAGAAQAASTSTSLVPRPPATAASSRTPSSIPTWCPIRAVSSAASHAMAPLAHTCATSSAILDRVRPALRLGP